MHVSECWELTLNLMFARANSVAFGCFSSTNTRVFVSLEGRGRFSKRTNELLSPGTNGSTASPSSQPGHTLW